MSYLGDTLTVGLILVLLFGSIALYLYTRIQQTEQKVSLLESIVLDLKLTGELPAFGEFPSAASFYSASSAPSAPSTLSAPVSPPLPPASSASDPLIIPLTDSVIASSPKAQPEYKPFLEDEEDVEELFAPSEPTEEVGGLGTPLVVEEETIALHPLPEESPYDTMSVKELQNAVRSRGLPSEKGAKKQALIELLKRADQANEIKPGSARSSTLLEISSPLSEDVE